MRRRLMIAALLVGLLAVPTASWAAKLFHSPSDDPNAQIEFPLQVTLADPNQPNLNLWLDPEGDTIFGLNMTIMSSGSLTVAFSCVADNCTANPVSEMELTMKVSLVAENIDPGWSDLQKIGDFDFQPGGAAGNQF